MSAELSRTDAFRVEQAKKLLADLKLMDFADERAAYGLLGRTEVVLAALVEVIEEGGAL
ncbi:MAG: hypothetical protein JWO67_1437 [Streptosporangiaceae bacterium]|nr:hypothetical protein [Streptosporangiaceae bacterium]